MTEGDFWTGYQSYLTNPDYFDSDEVEKLSKAAQRYGVPFEYANTDASLGSLATNVWNGFVQGFTTLPVGDKPTNDIDGIAHSIGHLMGFIGIIPGLGTVGSAVEFGFGIRKKAAFAALPQTYTDYVMLIVANGDIKAQGALKDTDESDVDTTDNWADGEVHTLEVYVSAAGAATFKIDGVAPTVNTHTLTFDDGDVVTPFFVALKDAGAGADVIHIELEVGLQ